MTWWKEMKREGSSTQLLWTSFGFSSIRWSSCSDADVVWRSLFVLQIGLKSSGPRRRMWMNCSTMCLDTWSTWRPFWKVARQQKKVLPSTLETGKDAAGGFYGGLKKKKTGVFIKPFWKNLKYSKKTTKELTQKIYLCFSYLNKEKIISKKT